MKKTMKNDVWFTSDTHYNHKNICYGLSDWTDKDQSCRKFDTIEEMNEKLIKNINDYVKENDTLYHLGDWSFGGKESIWEFRRRINCKNIILVPGNHDHHIKNNKPNKVKWIRDYQGPIDQWYEFDDYYKTEKECLEDCDTYYVPYKLEYDFPKDLFNDVLNQCDIVKINKQRFVLSHFPIEEWEDMGHGVIHLHGHCHHTKDFSIMNKNYRRMDVGIDWHEFRPFHFDEVMDLKNRPIYERYEQEM